LFINTKAIFNINNNSILSKVINYLQFYLLTSNNKQINYNMKAPGNLDLVNNIIILFLSTNKDVFFSF